MESRETIEGYLNVLREQGDDIKADMLAAHIDALAARVAALEADLALANESLATWVNLAADRSNDVEAAEARAAALEAAGDALADDADLWMPVYLDVNPPAHRQALGLVAAWRRTRATTGEG